MFNEQKAIIFLPSVKIGVYIIKPVATWVTSCTDLAMCADCGWYGVVSFTDPPVLTGPGVVSFTDPPVLTGPEVQLTGGLP